MTRPDEGSLCAPLPRRQNKFMSSPEPPINEAGECRGHCEGAVDGNQDCGLGLSARHSSEVFRAEGRERKCWGIEFNLAETVTNFRNLADPMIQLHGVQAANVRAEFDHCCGGLRPLDSGLAGATEGCRDFG